MGAERARLLPHALIEGGADASPRAAKRGRDDLEIREADIRCVEQQGHAKGLVARILGDEQARHEAVLQRIGELVGHLGDVGLGHRRELLAHDSLRRLDGRTVRRRRRVGDLANAEHVRCEACQALAGKVAGTASTISPMSLG